jgi:hypothetical protein
MKMPENETFLFPIGEIARSGRTFEAIFAAFINGVALIALVSVPAMALGMFYLLVR